MRKHSSLTREQKRRIWEIIDTTGTLEEVLLKGHLYLEYWINENVLDHFPKGELLLKQFYSFSQKVVLLEASGRLDFPIILDQLRHINNLRNDIAHELFPSNLETKVLAIPLNDVYGFGMNKNLNDPRQRLNVVIKTLITQIGHWADRRKHEAAKDAMR